MNIYKRTLDKRKKELEEIDKKIESTFSAYMDGLDKDICNEQLLKLKTHRTELYNEIRNIESNKPQAITIDLKSVKEHFNNLKTIYDSGSNEQKRTLFKTYIRKMDLDPELDIINIVFYPPDIQEKIKRGAISPRSI